MRWLLLPLLVLLPASAWAQYSGNLPPGYILGNDQTSAQPARPLSGLRAGLPELTGRIGYHSLSVSRDGTKAGLLGQCENSVDTLTFCPGVAGYGRIPSGHAGAAFGVTGEAELFNSAGTVIGAEFSPRNLSGTPPNGTLPPLIAIPSPAGVATAIGEIISCQWNGAGDTAGDCSLGLSVSNNTYDITKPSFLAGINVSYYKNAGIVISDSPAPAISLISKNSGANLNLLLQQTGAHDPSTLVAQLQKADGQPQWQMLANGMQQGMGHSWALISGAPRPTLSACGTSPSVNSSNDEAAVITVGTGTVTSCTLTFASTFATPVPPACIAQLEDPTDRVYISAKSATAVTISAVAGANIAGKYVNLLCRDQR